jgi:uncharacterized protein YjbI with pentapeptide repeats
MTQRTKKQEPTRDLPRLLHSTEGMPCAEAAVARVMLLEGLPIEEQYFADADLSGERIGSLTVSGSLLERVSLANCEIGSLRLRDVRLTGCDLSNARIRSFEATRVEFLRCRMVGLVGSKSHWQSVLLDTANARFAQLNDSRMRRSEFRETHLGEAVLSRCDLAESRFAQSILRQADLTGSRLNGLDLRSCDIEGLQIGIEDLRGARVSAAQALELTRLLGVVIG